MRLLQRYILVELLKVFSVVLMALTVLLVFVGVFRQASEYGFGPLQVWQIMPYVVPSMLPFSIPATFLLTVCVVYGRIAAEQEITATKAAGISLSAMLWPSFFLGAVLSVCALVLTDQVIPWSIANIERIFVSAAEDIALEKLRSEGQLTTPDGTTIAVLGVDGKRLINPVLRWVADGRPAVTAQAAEATIEFDLERELVLVHAVDCFWDARRSGGGFLAGQTIPFPLRHNPGEREAKHMSVQQISEQLVQVSGKTRKLRDHRDIEAALTLAMGNFGRFHHPRFIEYESEIRGAEKEAVRLRSEYHARFALSCSCFFFVLVGTPFAVLKARRQFLTSFFLVFMPILLCYYPVVLLMMNLAKTGVVNPAWGMWVGNVLLLVVAWFSLRAALRH
jgi:lipopolysaccharide export system permease protein